MRNPFAGIFNKKKSEKSECGKFLDDTNLCAIFWKDEENLTHMCYNPINHKGQHKCACGKIIKMDDYIPVSPI